ncbi:MAG: hypothetical protein HQL52_03360 [Magnetococcales bacterium]|nr:hypothetical protein [Magnetococcales bacterium]
MAKSIKRVRVGRVSIIFLAGVMALAVPSAIRAHGLPSYWSYAVTSQEMNQQIGELQSRIDLASKDYDAEDSKLKPILEEMTAQDRVVAAAERALERAKKPVAEAKEAYREVQAFSLENPEISTEDKRLDYLNTLTAQTPVIREMESVLAMEAEKKAQIQEQVNDVRERMGESLRRVESLTKQKDLMQDVVFLPLAAN